MYTLTLTASERSAIDWVGHRYAHGNSLYSCLSQHMKDDEEWSSDGEITFHLPEWAAWEISDIAETEEHRWDCFAPELAAKFEEFLAKVV